MALTNEWRVRLDAWRDELKRHFYAKLGDLELSGFVTGEQLRPQDALTREFRPTPASTNWGRMWEYGWFKTRVVVPGNAGGKRVVLRLNVGDREFALLANGRHIESHRAEWGFETLTPCAVPGETWDLLVHAYGGHGPTPSGLGPVPPGRPVLPEPAETQQTIGECSYGIWHEDAYQLHVDVETLKEIRDCLDENSLRVAMIDQGLRDFTLTADFELSPAEMIETFRAARKRLAPLLECRNGSTTPDMFCVGHAHIDIAWLWPLAEARCKAARTLANQLALIAEYTEYKFLSSQPALYQMVKEDHPQLYERVKKAVAAGGIDAEGGMWVEADTNLTAGESLIRQFLYGKQFFRDEFGVNSRVLWLPDVFGYSGALPQIMKGCGVEYFATTKLCWSYCIWEAFPYNTFTWEGIDGSEVVAHFPRDYTCETTPASVLENWNERLQRDNISVMLYPFGWGDGGGGPTRDHLEYMARLSDCEGVPRMRPCDLAEFFRELVSRGEHRANRYVGELYLQIHRGTLTSQARLKKLNRKCEFALRETEFWASAAAVLKGFEWPKAQMDELWKTTLLHQFHDILPGSSIQRVNEEAEAALVEAIGHVEAVKDAALASLADEDADGLVILNSLNWPRTALIELPDGWAEPEHLPVQRIQDRHFAEVDVPACGWTGLKPSGQPPANETECQALTVTQSTLANEFLRLKLNELGEIVSLHDKQVNRELLSEPSNVFKMYKDVPPEWDAWDIDSMYEQTPVELSDAPAQIDVLTEGPLVGVVRVKRKLNNSELAQEIRLRRGKRRVDFVTTIDWQERHKLLKVRFAPDIHTNEAIHEIQFGHLRRPNHFSRPFDQARFEVAQQKWSALAEENRGFALLNDCKYGISSLGKTLNLTLLRSPLAPDPRAEAGLHQFTYAAFAWNGSFAECDVVREAYDLNVPVSLTQGRLDERSLLSIDAPNIVLESLKPAHDGSGDIVIRLYESKRMATRCHLACSLPFSTVLQTNMLEEPDGAELPADELILDFRPFEIKTLRLSCTGGWNCERWQAFRELARHEDDPRRGQAVRRVDTVVRGL